jgi:hypothetical protein
MTTKSGFIFSKRSLNNLYGVHPELIRITYRALELSEVDFAVTEGLRTNARQRELVEQGKSQTYRSYHIPRFGDEYGRAVDVAAYVGGKISWEWEYYEKIAKAFKQAADELGYAIVWGGDWESFKDGPHFQLMRGDE